MGIMEEEARNPNAIQVRKKTCGAWVLLAIAAVILAAIIAFFVGSNSGECVLNADGSSALGSSNKNAKAPLPEKVRSERLRTYRPDHFRG